MQTVGCNLLHHKKAFTLSELLITLVVIGIIAAITAPIIMNKYKWAQYRSAAIKAQSILNNSVKMYHAKEGSIPQCAYWKKNNRPYDSSLVASTENEDGSKTYTYNGGPMPTDYNGPNSDCKSFYNFLKKNLNVVKYCDKNAYDNGCIIDYEGLDTMYRRKNGLSEDEKINVTIFTKEMIKKSSAIATADGMIFVMISKQFPAALMVDINGEKGPNKWGHDMHLFYSYISTNVLDVPKYEQRDNSSNFVDNGGKQIYKLIYGQD